MYYGFISINGEEFANAARAMAYCQTGVRTIPLRDCWDTPATFDDYMHGGPYTTPAEDEASWLSAIEAGAGYGQSIHFYGVFPLEVTGFVDSSRAVETSELVRGGAAAHAGRIKPRSIRLRMLALAGTRGGLEAGWAWIKDVFTPEGCGPDGGLCPQFNMEMYLQPPTNDDERAAYRRQARGIELVDGIKVIRDTQTATRAFLREFEVTLLVTVPGLFTTAGPVTAVNSGTETGGNGETYCPPRADAYGTLVFDPSSPVDMPPRPPTINSTMPTSWYRRTALYSPSGTDGDPVWGRITPVIDIASTAVRRNLRIRIYRDLNDSAGVDVGACDFEAEFYILYMPAGSQMTIDCRSRTVTLLESDGTGTPADHLVMGSYGRPPVWAELDCDSTYTVRVEAQTPQTGTSVQFRTYIRE